MQLFFTNETYAPFTEALFKPLLKDTEKRIKIYEKAVELVLMDDAAMQKLNKATRGLDKSTDVLSFANREIADPALRDPESLGQIFISIPAAERNAKDVHQSLEEELRFLFIHGLLHILGYDHQTHEDEFEMMSVAYEILGRSAYQSSSSSPLGNSSDLIAGNEAPIIP